MACFGIRYGSAGDCLIRQPVAERISRFNSLHSLSIPNLAIKSSFSRISTAATGAVTAVGVSDRVIDLSPAEAIVNGEDYDLSCDSPGVSEKAVEAEDWPEVVKKRPSSPDGIILVEELRDKIDLADSGDGVEEEDGTRAFGVLIQGRFKGRDRCKSACYLLKTSSVNGGMGPFCTHFCLMKVHSFSKSASSQFNDCWLLQ